MAIAYYIFVLFRVFSWPRTVFSWPFRVFRDRFRAFVCQFFRVFFVFFRGRERFFRGLFVFFRGPFRRFDCERCLSVKRLSTSFVGRGQSNFLSTCATIYLSIFFSAVQRELQVRSSNPKAWVPILILGLEASSVPYLQQVGEGGGCIRYNVVPRTASHWWRTIV